MATSSHGLVTFDKDIGYGELVIVVFSDKRIYSFCFPKSLTYIMYNGVFTHNIILFVRRKETSKIIETKKKKKNFCPPQEVEYTCTAVWKIITHEIILKPIKNISKIYIFYDNIIHKL